MPDRVPGADRLGEMVAGIDEYHRDVRADPGEHVDEHRFGHGGGDGEPGTEPLHRPAQDLLGRRARQLVAGV